MHSLPLDTGRKRSATTATKSRGFDFIDDFLAAHADGTAQAIKAAMQLVIPYRKRISAADAFKT